MTSALAAVIGVVLGAAIVLAIVLIRSRRDRETTRRLMDELQAQKAAEVNAIIDRVNLEFAKISGEALFQNTDHFLKWAKSKLDDQTTAGDQRLESKKKLIDAALATMNAKLTELAGLTQSVDKDRREDTGAIRADLAKATEATGRLRETTAQLREALSSSQRRGQWGERMAEDVLRLVGFIEGVNYQKQATVGTGERPDFTFLMPRGLKLNMDVKFPLDNYLRALDTDEPQSRKHHESAFLRDVRNQIKAVTTRAYINAEEGTVDCVLVFIPNEQVYHFIHEHDPALLDDAVKQKVVLCSPLTLYAVLAVVRQAVDNFQLERTSSEILELLGAFRGEWKKYCEVVDRMGRALDQAMRAFEQLQTTRTRQLERKLDRIEDLQQAKGLTTEDPIDEQRLVDV